jgi:NAD(P)-dependent dehydrogenase (short-subunit alcohol dehydrogenase family)
MHPNGHAALITGGGSGLGRATADRLAALGAKVALLDINGDAVKAAAEKVGGIGIACDVTSADNTAAAIAEARTRHGPARILVNCAGIGPAKRIVGRDGPQPLDDFARVISVNLIGTFNAMRLAAADMQTLDPLDDGERGVIISTASVAAYDGQIGQAAYSASKGGVVALTLPAAREFAQFGIRVMTIAPGIFSTPMMAGMPQQVQDSLAAAIPFPKALGRPEQYADLALHIVENRYLNGEVIRLDGAIRMAPK